MSDTSNIPALTQFEDDVFQTTMRVITGATVGVNGVDLMLTRGLVNGQPVPVVCAIFQDEQTDPDHVVSTPIAVLLAGDTVDLITFPESVGTVIDNPKYVGPVPANA